MRSNFSVVFLTMSGSGEDGARAERVRPADNNIVMEALRGQMQALMREMTHMRGEMGEMRAEREQGENEGRRNQAAPRQHRAQPRRRRDDLEEEYEEYDYDEGGPDRRRYEQDRRDNRREDDNLESIKQRIPEFKGRNDPKAYLDWEKKIEHVFDIHRYSDRKKVKLAVTEFTEYALTWWDQVATSRRRNNEHPVETWDEMKTIMKRQFVPAHYYREFHKRPLRLTQGSKSVEDYHQEMEMIMIRLGLEEDEEVIMARFIAGLNVEIANEIELHHYLQMHELLHKAIQIERQFKSGGRRSKFGERTPWKPIERTREYKE